MELIVRPTQVRENVNSFVYSLPGGGKTYFLLSSYYENGNERGGPVVFDTDKGGVDDTSLEMDILGKVPVFPVGDDEAEKIFYAVAYPKEIIEIVNAHPKFKDYKVTTFGIDTISSGIETLLGNSAMSFEVDDMAEIPATGIMKSKRKRSEGSPAKLDYKSNHNKARLWFRKARDIPYHLVVTCHATYAEEPGQDDKKEEDRTSAGYPNLPGQLKYDAAKLVDHFFYMEQTPGGEFVTHTRPYRKFNARSRIRRFLEPAEVNFTFPKLVQIYEKAKAAGEVAFDDE